MLKRTMGQSRWLILALLCVALCGCGDDRPKVRAAFNEYIQALLKRDSQKAVMRVDQASLDYYSEMRRLALEAGPVDLAARTPVDRLMVGMIRVNTTPSYLRQLTGSQLYMYAVQEGWSLDDAMPTSEISDIEVDGDTATATCTARGHLSAMDYHFVKESGQWKLNITASLEAISSALKHNAATENVPLDQFLITVLHDFAPEKTVTESVWQKPK